MSKPTPLDHAARLPPDIVARLHRLQRLQRSRHRLIQGMTQMLSMVKFASPKSAEIKLMVRTWRMIVDNDENALLLAEILLKENKNGDEN